MSTLTNTMSTGFKATHFGKQWIERYHSCPFCPSSAGEVGVDVNRIVEWLLTNATRKLMSTDYETHPAKEILSFAPGESGCDHLIALSCISELHVERNLIRDTVIDYDHSWFRRWDPDVRSNYSQFVFDHYLDGDVDTHDPRFGRLAKSWVDRCMASSTLAGVELTLTVSGYAFFVERPDRFFDAVALEFAASAPVDSNHIRLGKQHGGDSK